MSLRAELAAVAVLALAVTGWAGLVASESRPPATVLPVVQVGASPSPMP